MKYAVADKMPSGRWMLTAIFSGKDAFNKAARWMDSTTSRATLFSIDSEEGLSVGYPLPAQYAAIAEGESGN